MFKELYINQQLDEALDILSNLNEISLLKSIDKVAKTLTNLSPFYNRFINDVQDFGKIHIDNKKMQKDKIVRLYTTKKNEILVKLARLREVVVNLKEEMAYAPLDTISINLDKLERTIDSHHWSNFQPGEK